MAIKSPDRSETLLELNQWALDVTSGLDGNSHQKSTQGAERLKWHVKRSLAALTSCVNESTAHEINTHAITVRSSCRQSSPYMRPVYSVPEDLGQHIKEPSIQRPFSLSLDNNEPFRGLCDPLLAGDKSDPPGSIVIGLYPISGEIPADDHEQSCFAGRIELFWNGLGDASYSSVKQIKDDVPDASSLFCLFASRRKHTVIEDRYESDMLVALYFSIIVKDHKRALRDLQLDKQKLVIITQELFTGIDLINNVDTSIFRYRGLELVNRMLPVFDRSDVSPADKIAFVIEKFKTMLNQHLVGRYGWESDQLDIHYITTTFELQKPTDVGIRQRCYQPNLRIYPIAYSEENALGALRVAHREIPSAVKLLLHRYLESATNYIMEASVFEEFKDEADDQGLNIEELTNIEKRFTVTTHNFSQLVTSLNTPDMEEFWDHVCPNLHSAATPEFNQRIEDTLVLSIHDHLIDQAVSMYNSQLDAEIPQVQSLWNCLNQQADPDNSNRSLVAFVVEGSPHYNGAGVKIMQLPRGILVIESKQINPFADSDILSLRAVSQGIAELIRKITNENSCIDFRSALMSAQTERADPVLSQRDSETFKRLLFCTRKINLAQLQKFEARSDSTIILKNEFGLDEYALDLLRQLIRGLPTELNYGRPVSEQTDVELIVAERVYRSFKILNQLDFTNGDLNALVNFLEAFPENTLYSSYFTSISRALDSIISTDGLPAFRSLKPGFSAVGIFSAHSGSEMRHVVKLSNGNKLLKELMSYRKHVRYKIINAARFPANGYAFDNAGMLGRELGGDLSHSLGRLPENYAENAYGVLVSDLVTGESDNEVSKRVPDEVIKTLLTTLVSCYLGISDPTKVRGGEAIPTSQGPGALIQGIIERHASVSVRIICKALTSFFSHNQKLWQVPATSSFATQIQILVRTSYRLPSHWVNENNWIHRSSWANPTPKEVLDEQGERKFTQNSQRLLMNTSDKYLTIPGNDGIDLIKIWEGSDNQLLSGVSIKSFTTIMHGDLNARNLVFVGAISNFFYIDYEHVGHGIIGADSFRLIINMITDSFGGALEVNLGNEEKQVLADSVNTAISIIEGFHKQFIDPGFRVEDITLTSAKQKRQLEDHTTELHIALEVPLHNVLEELFTNSNGPEILDPLTAVICTIINQISYDDALQNSDEFGHFVSYALKLAAIAEFQASVRNIGDKPDISFLSESLYDTTIQHLVSLVIENIDDETMHIFYFRYLISAKILQHILKTGESE